MRHPLMETAGLPLREKRHLLARLLAERDGDSTPQPLSYGQQAMWLLHRLEPDSSIAYNLPFVWSVQTNLDVPALRRAFQRLTDHHPILRTVYADHNGAPYQQVLQRQDVELRLIDAAGATEERFRELLVDQTMRRFDLESGPVFRVAVFERDGHRPVLLLVIHHIAIDGWSLFQLLEELGESYALERAGEPVALPPPASRYTDFVRWQEDLLSGPDGARLEAYWLERLGGEPPVLELPSDRPRPRHKTYRGASHAFTIDEDLTSRIQELGRREGVTLFMTLLAGFEALLQRHSGQDDILIGTSTLGRSRPEFVDVVGYFVNPVVLRADLSGDPTFRELLGRVRVNVLGALEHQDYPLPLLVERLQAKRDPSRSPLFDVTFTLRRSQRFDFRRVASVNGHEGASPMGAPSVGERGMLLDVGGLSLESFPLEQPVARFDIEFQMLEADGLLSVLMQYNADLFDQATMERMGARFVRLLRAASSMPEARLSDLAWMPEAERHQVLAEWNPPVGSWRPRRCVHEWIEEQMARSPEAVAATLAGRRLTYAELNRRANQLARLLQCQGIGPEKVVGVCLERSFELLTALLGVLKAGGAYVPLDPGLPAERLGLMLADSGARVVVTEQRLRAGFSPTGVQVISLDADAAALAAQPSGNLGRTATSANLAYVIYTSGSTGRPKGVLVEHRGLENFLQWCVAAYACRGQGGAPLFSSFAFDMIVPNLYTPLLLGQPVHLLPEALDLARLGQALEEAGPFSFIKLTPGHLDLLAHHLSADAARNLAGVLVVGADAFPSRSLASWQALGSSATVLNEYGPTEATVANCVHRIDGPVDDQLVPIGRPIPNTTMYVLDERLRPLPVGVPGELYIGGVCVARGYHDLPRLTAERFVPDPFSNRAGARLYRTGDRGRFRPDGTLEFLGRVDDQLKLHGYRIEPGEIEAALTHHPAIRHAVVTAPRTAAGGRRLVAHLVPATADRPGADELRQALTRQLPAYMLPSSYVYLEALPLNANGKLDRAGLSSAPAPELSSYGTPARPETAVQTAVVLIVAAVLSLDPAQVGMQDNFFDLGGYSMAAIGVANRIQEDLGVELSLAEVLRQPTLAALAEEVTASLLGSTDEAELVRLLDQVERWPPAGPALSGEPDQEGP
jgi:amino acid adenylation domain-containing protein